MAKVLTAIELNWEGVKALIAFLLRLPVAPL